MTPPIPTGFAGPLLVLALAGCTGETPSAVPAASPAIAGATASLPTATAGAEAAGPTIRLWLDPDFAPETAPRLQALLDRWRAAHPEAQLAVALRPTRGPTGAGAFLDALSSIAPGRLPDVAMVPLDGLPAARERGLVPDLEAPVLAERAAAAFPFAARLASGEGGAAWAVPVAVDVAHLIDAGAPAGSWDDRPPDAPIVVPPPDPDPASLSAVLAAYAAADGALDALAAPDEAALTVALGALDAARLRGLLVTATAGMPLGPATEAGGRAAVVGAGGLAGPAAGAGSTGRAVADATWGPLPGLDGAAPPVAWGWGLIVPAADAERRALAIELVEGLTRPEEAAWVMDHGHLPAHPAALDAALGDPARPAGWAAYGDFLSVQLAAAAPIALPASEWERWRVAVASLYQGEGASAAVAALVPER